MHLKFEPQHHNYIKETKIEKKIRKNTKLCKSHKKLSVYNY